MVKWIATVLITNSIVDVICSDDESARWEHAVWPRATSDELGRTIVGVFNYFLWKKEGSKYKWIGSESKPEIRPTIFMFSPSGLGVNQTSLKIQDGSSRFEDRAGRSSTHYRSVELSHLIIRKIHKNSQKFMNNHVTQVRIRTCQWLS